jgi:hypothetical protein
VGKDEGQPDAEQEQEVQEEQVEEHWQIVLLPVIGIPLSVGTPVLFNRL